MYVYLSANAFGMALPIVSSYYSFHQWLHQTSPEQDYLVNLYSLRTLKLAGMVLVLTQGHMATLTLMSFAVWKKHPLLLQTKLAEVVESCISSLVQFDFVTCYLCKLAAQE